MPTPLPGITPERMRHGSRSRYVSGCRCDACRAANTAAYHQRQQVAIEAARELPERPTAPAASRPWTAADGSVRQRTYQRACPGVNGNPCPRGSYLRKDSKGGVCNRCRELLVWDGLVPADRARKYLRRLSRRGVGRRAVAAACDVTESVLHKIATGRKKQIRASTERKILGVDKGAASDHALIDAKSTWTKVEHLIEHEGFTKAEIARRLGYASPRLQLQRERVTARNALRIDRLYRDALAINV